MTGRERTGRRGRGGPAAGTMASRVRAELRRHGCEPPGEQMS